MISREEIERIKRDAKIDGVIGRFVELRRSGVRWIGNCPFCGDQKRKLTVWPDRQIFKCFGNCTAKGDVFQFLREHRNLTFEEAVREVCDLEGLPAPRL